MPTQASTKVSKDLEVLSQTLIVKRSDFKKYTDYEKRIGGIADDIYWKFFAKVGFKPQSVDEMQKWMFHHFKQVLDVKPDEDMTKAFIVYYQKPKATREQKLSKTFDPLWPVFRKYKKAILFQANAAHKEELTILRYKIY